ncbi:MAG: hypothetical protein LQ352_002467 [Teloschistes flavicans]|nr:MAG: hypothetical protein LQ352_002467 [Teloschistes flavicans]
MKPSSTTGQDCPAGNNNLEERLRGMLLSHGVPPQDESQSRPSTVNSQLQTSHNSSSQNPVHTAGLEEQLPRPTRLNGGSAIPNKDHPGRTRRITPRTQPASNHASMMANASASVGSPQTYSMKTTWNNRQLSAPKASDNGAARAEQANTSAASPLPSMVPAVQRRASQPLPHPRHSGPGFSQQQARMPVQPWPPLNGPQHHDIPSLRQLHGQHTQAPVPSYGRPPPQNRQLYNPHAHINPMQAHAGRQGLSQNRNDPHFQNTPAQTNFLNTLAEREVPKAAISTGEEQEKEQMRGVLENICRTAITEYETMKDPRFESTTVTLDCFGSLRSGFATLASDMDLALGSPTSTPDAASPKSEIPRLLEKALLDLGYGARLLTRTRVPIIRFCEKPTPELTSLLLEERLKWEKERDSSPKVNKMKPSKTNNDSKQLSDAQSDGKKPMEPLVVDASTKKLIEQDLNHDTSNINSKPAADDDQKRGTTTSLASPAATDEVTPKFQKVEQTTADLSVGAKEAKSSNESSSSDGGISLQQSLGYGADNSASQPSVEQTAVANVKSQEPITGRQTDLEKPASASRVFIPKPRRETILPDDEIVRLYRLAMREGWFEPQERGTIFAFIKAVEAGCAEDQLVEPRKALLTLPDILNRYRPPPEHHLDFPKDGVGVQCDINFSNRLALHNSAMLRCYNLCDSRIKPMVIFIKAWAKRRKINSPYHGTLSSYGYVLMVLHYLVNITNPPICPNLQTFYMAARDDCPENHRIIDGHSVRFWRNEKAIQQWVKTGMMTEDRHSTVGSLLRGFFQYYAIPSNGFSWSTDVLSLRTPGGILTKHQKGWVSAKTTVVDPVHEGQKAQEIRHRYLFAIEDPFETEHNIARTVVHNGIVAIRDEFRRAQRLIHAAGNGNTKEDLFEEAAAKDDLNYRYFGPRPRPMEHRGAADAAKGQKDGKEDSNQQHSSMVGERAEKGDGRQAARPKQVGGTETEGDLAEHM